ncbi:MAG: HDOD domain-containing protein [Rhodocyclaceae bacterium]|nr:MAG: HDOD domain-containing protein [Rhodocyclaceae bacterium]
MKQAINDEEALKDLIGRGLKIPPWPKVLAELQQSLEQGDYDNHTLARIIGKDPGLAAMVFKVAKSPLFAKGKKNMDRLDQVLMMLGTKQLLSLVQAVALTTSLSEGKRKAFDAFWTRSSDIAEMAALIADDRVSVCNIFPEQAYMAGIFRECGIPVLMQRFPDYCKKVSFDRLQCELDVEDEDAKLNVDHCVIGYLVARHWKLPDFVATAILYHEEMPREEFGAVRSLVAILHLARHYCNHVMHVETPGWEDLEAEVLAELGLHPDEEKEFRQDMEERFHGEA